MKTQWIVLIGLIAVFGLSTSILRADAAVLCAPVLSVVDDDEQDGPAEAWPVIQACCDEGSEDQEPDVPPAE